MLMMMMVAGMDRCGCNKGLATGWGVEETY